MVLQAHVLLHTYIISHTLSLPPLLLTGVHPSCRNDETRTLMEHEKLSVFLKSHQIESVSSQIAAHLWQ